MRIRLAVAEDDGVLADVMFDAVHHGCHVYSHAQRQAWVPARCSGIKWIERLAAQSIFVAEISGQVVGFMSLAGHGYIDFVYLRPSAQGTGIFRQLYHSIESLALQTGVDRLWVHASLMAQPAFTAMGFTITVSERIDMRGQSLQRFNMEKQLYQPVRTLVD
ncbi:MAG: GNAT family N-acetyltransferase [Rubripirellula sp.]|nr:GNAT family N-acetyltransferase [Rubripirellula sp.]